MGLVPGTGFVIILGFALFAFLFPGAWRTRLVLSGVFLAWALAIRMGREALLSALNSMPPTCPLRAWFGIKCSFCGMTHALIHFLFFDFGAAISENPLSLPLFGFSLAGMLVAVIQPNVFDAAVGFLRRPGPRMVATWSALGVLGVFTLLRNL